MDFHFISFHMGFQLVAKVVTLNDYEQHSGRYFVLFTDLGVNYVTVVEVTLCCLQQKCDPKTLVFRSIWFMMTQFMAKTSSNVKIHHMQHSTAISATAALQPVFYHQTLMPIAERYGNPYLWILSASMTRKPIKFFGLLAIPFSLLVTTVCRILVCLTCCSNDNSNVVNSMMLGSNKNYQICADALLHRTVQMSKRSRETNMGSSFQVQLEEGQSGSTKQT